MEACPGLDRTDEDSFERGIAFLKSRAEYVFKKRRENPTQWELSTWSRHVRRSSIENHGTDSDKAALPTGTSRFNKPSKMGTFNRKRQLSNHRRICRQPPQQQRTAVPVLPDDSDDEAAQSLGPSAYINEESQPPELPESPRRSIRLAAIRAAAKVTAAALADNDSSSGSSKWESPLPAQLELPESPIWSMLRSAARVAAKKAARQAEEDEETETEDEEWGANILDAMVDQLGTRREVEKDVRDHCWKLEFAQRLANFYTCRRGWEPSDDD
jgi:hypothetical protein